MSGDQEAMLFAVALGGGIILALIAYSVVNALQENGNATTNVSVYFFLEYKQTYSLNNTTFMSFLRLYPYLMAEYEALDRTDIKIETHFDFMPRMK